MHVLCIYDLRSDILNLSARTRYSRIISPPFFEGSTTNCTELDPEAYCGTFECMALPNHEI